MTDPIPMPTQAQAAMAAEMAADKLIAERRADIIGPCRRCSIPVYWDHTGKLAHASLDGRWARGCRAASFTVERGHNDDLDGKWMAQAPVGAPRGPVKKTPMTDESIARIGVLYKEALVSLQD